MIDSSKLTSSQRCIYYIDLKLKGKRESGVYGATATNANANAECTTRAAENATTTGKWEPCPALPRPPSTRL